MNGLRDVRWPGSDDEGLSWVDGSIEKEVSAGVVSIAFPLFCRSIVFIKSWIIFCCAASWSLTAVIFSI